MGFRVLTLVAILGCITVPNVAAAEEEVGCHPEYGLQCPVFCEDFGSADMAFPSNNAEADNFISDSFLCLNNQVILPGYSNPSPPFNAFVMTCDFTTFVPVYGEQYGHIRCDLSNQSLGTIDPFYDSRIERGALHTLLVMP